MVSIFHELQQTRPRDVRVLDKRQFNLESVWHRDIVGVHASDDVEPARDEPLVKRRSQSEVAGQGDESHRHEAVRAQIIQEGGEVVVHWPITNDDELIRPHALVVDGAAERPPNMGGSVAAVHGHQEREGFVHGADLTFLRGRRWRPFAAVSCD